MTQYRDIQAFDEGWKNTNAKKYFTQRRTAIHKITTSADAAVAQSIDTGAVSVTAGNANDGDKYFAEAFCDGTETVLVIAYRKNTTFGKFDVYLNGVKDDQATIDAYGASTSLTTISITLSTAPVAGYNLIELRVNGQNASSTDYVLAIDYINLY